MKKIISVLLPVLLIMGLLAGCAKKDTSSETDETTKAETVETKAVDLGDDTFTFGESLSDLNAYDGYFEEDVADVTVTCVSGSSDCYTLKDNTLTFTALSEDSVYSVSGKLRGNIVIDIGDERKLDLELKGLSIVSDTVNPITVNSGDKVSITAKSEYKNYIYDIRSAVDESDETVYSGAIYSLSDLEICGKGALTLVSENNNGIHSKDDLEVKNLTLLVACADNALKGNDSVEISEAETILIATQGDAVKTTNSDISSKGNQRGTVIVSGGTHTIYAACDGIDAAYNVEIDTDSTNLSIYTDKYSNYSAEVTAVAEESYYLRATENRYAYSVEYYNSESDSTWVNAEYDSAISGMRTTYYYYTFPKMAEYGKMKIYVYQSTSAQGKDAEYLTATDYISQSSAYDTVAVSYQGNNVSYQWTNYTTTVQDNEMMGGPGGMGMGGMGMGGMGGPGGMSDGNTDKGDYSTKGIKADNEIIISAGTVSIKSYDDAIHASADISLENGNTSKGNIKICGGNITAYSNDDGVHADGNLSISSGSVSISNSYEGLEGDTVKISGGSISVISSDDGINGTNQSATAIEISGGTVYINCSGDGIDSNSRASYSGIVFSGGSTVIISDSNNNSAIDTEQGYKYSGGNVLAIMPRSGMTNEITNCSNCSSVGKQTALSLNSGDCLTVTSNGSAVVSVKMPISLSAAVLFLGSSSAEFSTASTSLDYDSDGVYRR